MASANPIPEKYINGNIYIDGKKLVGTSGEFTLPNLSPTTSTISGAGIAGEIESPNIGHFGSLTTEINFRTVGREAVELATPETKMITIRGAQQISNVSAGTLEAQGFKVTFKGKTKEFDLGKLSNGNPTETKVTIELEYLRVDIDGVKMVEVDKYNFIYYLNGVDYLEQVAKLM